MELPRFIFVLIFGHFSVSCHNLGYYPWLEQMTRQELLSRTCRDHSSYTKNRLDFKRDLDHILVDHQHKLLYCYVPKVACTNWKRVFMVLTGHSDVKNLLDIPGSLAHFDNSTLKLNQLDSSTIRHCLSNYRIFIMVRHPFERLLSAFRNKFEQTYSEYFKVRYGRDIIKKYRRNPSGNDLETGSNVRFSEFVKYLLDEGPTTNEHWDSIYNLCKPCLFNYTLIGRYETLSEDVRTIFDWIGAPQIDFPSTKGSNTSERLKSYFKELSMVDIQRLHHMYEADFKMFGYNLEELLGFDLG